MQVIRDYCKYADSMIGRWAVKEDGHKHPSVRVLIRPLLNLFHGERKSKRWKSEIDRFLLKKPPPETVSEVMDCTLHILDDEILDSPPEAAQLPAEPFTAEQTGEWPPPALPDAPGHERPAVCIDPADIGMPQVPVLGRELVS
jgi:hypothetical protein